MLNIVVCEISPLLLENVALRMGNLQVTKISCGREWTLSQVCVLGALICNGMVVFLLLFVPYVLFLKFSRIIVELRFYEILC
jgi:hypothetical protein